MRALIAFFLALAAAVAVGVFLSRHSGYVLISYGTTQVEFTLFVFLLIYLAALFLCTVCVGTVRRIVSAPKRLARLRDARATSRAERMLMVGLTSLAEGRLGQAERALAVAARGPLLLPALLAAARAADLADARERRDEYLRRAYEASPKAASAVLLEQAALDLARGDSERALAALKKVRHGRGTHPFALRDLVRVHASLGDHAEVLKLLPALEGSAVLPAEEIERLAAAALEGLGAREHDAEAAWKLVPRKLRERPAVRRAGARLYAAANNPRRAADLLAQNLDAGVDADSARDYAELTAIPASERLHRFESWLDRHSNDPLLLREAGRVALELRLWGQARSYLEEARRRGGADLETGLLSGRAAEEEGRNAEALAAYRSGLEAASRPASPGHGS